MTRLRFIQVDEQDVPVERDIRVYNLAGVLAEHLRHVENGDAPRVERACPGCGTCGGTGNVDFAPGDYWRCPDCYTLPHFTNDTTAPATVAGAGGLARMGVGR